MEKDSLPLYLAIGFTISSLSPFFISMVAIPGNLFAGNNPNMLILLFGIALFLPQLAIWYSYSRRISSAGGLFKFTESAVGRRIANIQGFFWILSYLLYLPFTIAYIVYYLLPEMFNVQPGILATLEILLPAAIILSMFLHRKLPFFILLLAATLQIAAIIVMSAFVLSHSLPATQASTTSTPLPIPNIANISLLFVCGSLVLFLGGEITNPKRNMGIIIVSAFAFTVIFIALSAYLFVVTSPFKITGSEMPGLQLASLFTNPNFVFLFAITMVLGIIGLVTAEFIALSRLFTYLFKLSMNRSYAYISVFFLAACFISLINPLKFYNYTIIPSIIALYISEAIVFLAYPFFARKHGMLNYYRVALAIAATAVALYGLYGVLAYPASYAI